METSGREFGASGLVGPWIERDDDDSHWDGSLFGDESSVRGESEEEDQLPLRLCLSNIVDINVHHITATKDVDRWVRTILHRRPRLIQSYSKIYLETDQAWYILFSPSPAYAPFYSTFWIQSRICNLCLLHVIQNPRTTLAQFIEKLPLLDFQVDVIGTTFDILGREISEDDFSDDVVCRQIPVRMIFRSHQNSRKRTSYMHSTSFAHRTSLI